MDEPSSALEIRRPLVVGLGHPLRRDDALGLHILAELMARQISGVDFLVGGQDLLSLLEHLTCRPRLIVLDALDTGHPWGTVSRLVKPCAQLIEALSSSEIHSHSTNLNLTLALMTQRKLPLPLVTIYGIQPADVMLGHGLTPPVARAAHFLVEQILVDEPWSQGEYLPDAIWLAAEQVTYRKKGEVHARFRLDTSSSRGNRGDGY